MRGIFRDPGNSGEKRFLVFDDVVKLVDEDIGLSGGFLNPKSFHALRNAVTLSKLSLLDAAELNRLHRDIAGDLPTRYGPTLYGDQVGKRFSLLFYALRSIDGNHQWQPFGFPYLRRDKLHAPTNPNLRRYGHSVHDNPFDGFRLFQDPISRERVFLQIFTGPVEGNLAKIPEAQAPDYPYPACERNPFPRTVDDLGFIILPDTGCSGLVAVKQGPKAPKAKTTAYVPDRKHPADTRPQRKKPRIKAVVCSWEGFGFGDAPKGVRVSIVAYGAAAKRDFAQHRRQCSWGSFGWSNMHAVGWWQWRGVERSPWGARPHRVKHKYRHI